MEMYGWSFNDPDGYLWEAVWVDPSHLAQPETLEATTAG
jgi:predicted lactoylglutathione lyase